MPRAKSDNRKSSEELDAEIEKLKQELEDKRKVRNAAKRREDAAAAQALAMEEDRFNRDFVAKAKEIKWNDGQTIYDVIRGVIRPAVSSEPQQAMVEPERKHSSTQWTQWDAEYSDD